MTTWELEKLIVHLINGEWFEQAYPVLPRKFPQWVEKPLSESPYLLALKHKDKKIFRDYSAILRQRKDAAPEGIFREPMTYEEFVDLYEDVKRNGIKDTSTMWVGENYIVGDGHHRLAILLHLGEKTITLPDKIKNEN